MSPIQVGQPWQSDPRELSLRPFTGTPQEYEALAHIRNETLRPVTLPQHFHAMSADDIAAFYNRAGFVLTDNAWLLFHADEPVGAAVVYPRAIFQERPPGNFDMYVVPRLRRHGLGSRLLAHLEQAATARGHRALETTVAREDEHSTGFLARHGFGVVAQSARLVRDGGVGLPTADLPEGFSIRSLAELGEPPEFYAETTNRLGAYDYNYSLITPQQIEQIAASDGWDPAGVLFLFDPSGRIVGVIRASTLEGGRGFLHEVRVEPASRGRGLGMALVRAALQYLQGVQRVELDTTGENTPAHNLALKAGFAVVRHWLHFLKPLMRDA